MKELKYVPKQCEEGQDFSGFILVRVPTFDERYDLLDQIGLKVENGEMKMEESSSFQSIRKMVTVSSQFYKSVEIKHKDGRSYSSLDDLKTDPDCDSILIDVAMAVGRGFRPSKS